MITHEELQAKAQKYARCRGLSADERSCLLELLRDSYAEGFMQGYTCAGGVVSASEAAEAPK